MSDAGLTDPAAAGAWVSQLPESPLARAGAEQVAIAWANADLQSARAFVSALPEGAGKQGATLALAYEADRSEPIAALELASTLAVSRERDDLLVHSVSQWPESDAATAAEWASRVPDPSLRQRLLAAVAVASAGQNGGAAGALAANALSAGEGQNRAVVSIVQRWAQHAPSKAAAWVSQFPNAPSRDTAVENLLAAWVTQDAEAAGIWVQRLPVGTMHDFGHSAYLRALAMHEKTSPVPAPVSP